MKLFIFDRKSVHIPSTKRPLKITLSVRVSVLIYVRISYARSNGQLAQRPLLHRDIVIVILFLHEYTNQPGIPLFTLACWQPI